MKLPRLIQRAARVEQTAAEIYDDLARRFRDDGVLRQLWKTMAADERRHAKKLSTWRQLVELTASSEDPALPGFSRALDDIEALLRDLRARVGEVRDADDAFEIALTLESSEIDALYTELLRISPIARFPDLPDLRKAETGSHHVALCELVRARSRSEANRLMAALLEQREH